MKLLCISIQRVRRPKIWFDIHAAKFTSDDAATLFILKYRDIFWFYTIGSTGN